MVFHMFQVIEPGTNLSICQFAKPCIKGGRKVFVCINLPRLKMSLSIEMISV